MNSDLSMAIDKTFGNFDDFVEIFTASTNTHKTSGWTWLVYNKNTD